ncbi:predicted protein [Plenodomus lingam JN3]|uniref:Predicted protein n=1 Tax=Leptosphaeria maculans (strain JN3 / isolate v23.1.3 / race Av1-4-5-6-7-8) TaxID=985895 RepID=E5A1X6_LEPMJ|nr:predicted protein [Plenodomus lingam JN3]CBX97693.1 predicted protein [Plenodomus lingam JN3]
MANTFALGLQMTRQKHLEYLIRCLTFDETYFATSPNERCVNMANMAKAVMWANGRRSLLRWHHWKGKLSMVHGSDPTARGYGASSTQFCGLSGTGRRERCGNTKSTRRCTCLFVAISDFNVFVRAQRVILGGSPRVIVRSKWGDIHDDGVTLDIMRGVRELRVRRYQLRKLLRRLMAPDSQILGFGYQRLVQMGRLGDGSLDPNYSFVIPQQPCTMHY